MAIRKRVTKAVPKAPAAGREVGCTVGVCDPQRTQGLKTRVAKGTHSLVSLAGPGVFISAHVTKQGGATGLTFVKLRIDNRNVVDLSFAAARNWGFIVPNPYGLQVLGSGGLENFTIGWPVPLAFKKSLELSTVVNETGVVQIVANVIHGSSG